MSFIFEAVAWLAQVLLAGMLDLYPKLTMAIFESNATWLPSLLDHWDRLFKLYANERTLKTDRLPSEAFAQQCFIAFESDETAVFRQWDRFEDVGVWSSDAYHHDGADSWSAIREMQAAGVPEDAQAKLLGGNARRMYGIERKTLRHRGARAARAAGVVPRRRGARAVGRDGGRPARPRHHQVRPGEARPAPHHAGAPSLLRPRMPTKHRRAPRRSPSRRSAANGHVVVDVDSHVYEPTAIWEKYLDRAYRVIARSAFWHERRRARHRDDDPERPARALARSGPASTARRAGARA